MALSTPPYIGQELGADSHTGDVTPGDGCAFDTLDTSQFTVHSLGDIPCVDDCSITFGRASSLATLAIPLVTSSPRRSADAYTSTTASTGLSTTESKGDQRTMSLLWLEIQQFESIIRGRVPSLFRTAKLASLPHPEYPTALYDEKVKSALRWDHRQLLGSFVTLICTSPGFIAAALAAADTRKFLSGVPSPLSILFHLVGPNPVYFAALVSELRSEAVTLAVMGEFAALGGVIVGDRKARVERFILKALSDKKHEHHNELATLFVTKYIKDLVSPLYWEFIALSGTGTLARRKHLSKLVMEVLTVPHNCGLLETVYISESDRKKSLDLLAAEIINLLSAQVSLDDTPFSGKDVSPGMVALLSADLLSIYEALLPLDGSAAIVTGAEWSLGNIRTDLSPAMRLLGSSPTFWHYFAASSDGLIAEVDQSMYLIDDYEDPVAEAVATARETHVESILRDRISTAESFGDYIGALKLRRAAATPAAQVMDDAVARLEQRIETLQQHCEKLARIQSGLDSALANKEMRSRYHLHLSNSLRLRKWYNEQRLVNPSISKARDLISRLCQGYMCASNSGSNSGVSGTLRRLSRRRLSILSTHSLSTWTDDDLFVSRDYLPKAKLGDKDSDLVEEYMQQNRAPNFCNCEEIWHRFCVEIAIVARQLNHMCILNRSPDDLKTLLFSDLGWELVNRGTETDRFMQLTGRMLLEGDGQWCQPILEDIAALWSPHAKLLELKKLVKLAGAVAEEEDIGVEALLTRSLCRETGGALYRDLQVVGTLIPAVELDMTPEFWMVADAAIAVMDTVLTRSMDLADRILRYHIESHAGSRTTMSMGISDAVAIWSFCARSGCTTAQRRLAQLYDQYPHTTLEMMPFCHAAELFHNVEPAGVREAVVRHWVKMAESDGGRTL